MATKEDVKNFVTAVRAKAIKAINAKHEEDYVKAVSNYMDSQHSDLKMKVEAFRDLMAKATKDGNELKELLGFPRYTTLASEFTNFRTDMEIFEQLYAYGKLNKEVGRGFHALDNVLTLKKEWDKEITATREEYDKIIREISRNCRDGRSALRLVKALGFDTSSIEEKPKEELKFDKEKLFVCGEDRA